MDEIFGAFALLLLDPKLLAVIIVLSMFVAIPYAIWNHPVSKTEMILSSEVRELCRVGELAQESNDHWGVNVSSDIREDGNGSIFCTVTSAGRDNEFGTDDDLVATAQYINKSRIAGNWLRNKGKEAIKGAIFGDKSNDDNL